MEKLTILRMFAILPLFGLLLPDIAINIAGSFNSIPQVHIYIEGFLLLFIAACTWRIGYIKKIADPAQAGL